MVDTLTTKADLLDPEVLGSMVTNTTQAQMRFMPLADIDRTLVGTEGDTIKVPMWTDNAVAQEVAEGTAIPVTKMSQGYTTATVSKFGIGEAFTDEADIERFGDNVSHATLKISNALAQYGDKKLMELALASKNTLTTTADIDGIDAMIGSFNTDVDGAAYTLICSPKTRLALKRAVREYTKGSDTGAQLAISGAESLALGASVAATNNMADGKIVVVLSSAQDIALQKARDAGGSLTDQELEALNSGRAFKWYVKRDAMIEADRDKSRQINYLYGTEIAAPYIQNPSKVLVATVDLSKATAGTTSSTGGK